MKNWFTPLLLVVSLAAFTSCASTSEIITTGLRIELTQIERSSDGTIQATWRVKNPNIVPYLIDRSTHKVTLDGVLVGTITDSARLGIAAQSQVERTSVLKPANAQVADRLVQLAAKGSASYQLSSAIVLLLYDDETSKSTLTGSGSVAIRAK